MVPPAADRSRGSRSGNVLPCAIAFVSYVPLLGNTWQHSAAPTWMWRVTPVNRNNWATAAVACSLATALTVVGCGSDDDDGGSAPVATATPAGPTNTPEPTATPGGPTNTPVATATPGGAVSNEVQAFVGSVVGALASLGDIGTDDGSGAGFSPFPITVPCTGGGSQTINCGAAGGGIVYELDFDECSNPGAFLDAVLTIESSGACLGNPLPTGSPATITFVGDIDTEDPETGTTFAGTVDIVSVMTFFASGAAEFSTSGSVTSDCIGGTATFETTETIIISPDAVCPIAGRIEFSIEGSSHEVEYSPEGVVIDGESFDSCESVATCN